MLQFNTKKIYSNSDHYEKLTGNLINAVIYTAQKYRVDPEKLFYEALCKIIYNGDFCGITRDKGMRESVEYNQDQKQYIDRSEYFEIIIQTLRKTDKYNLSRFFTESYDNYNVSEENLDFLIRIFCMEVSNTLKNNINGIHYPNPHISTPSYQNIQMYPPSKKLKDAIINNTQTKIASSSYAFNGMTAYSSVGKQRTNQEDSYYIGTHPQNSEFKILVVADGMGGSSQGEIASNIAVKELMQWFDTLPGNEYNQNDNRKLAYLLQQKVNEIQRKICEKINDGGTTLCVSIIKNNSIVMGNIGDSQGYIIEDNKIIHATTPDSHPIKNLGVQKDIARFHKMNNAINSFVGIFKGEEAYPEMCITEAKIKSHSIYKVIMCSDGVTDCISEKQIIKIANESSNPSQALVEYAIENDSYLAHELNELFNELSIDEQYAVWRRYQNGEFNDKINAGKDNTTAVSAVIKR